MLAAISDQSDRDRRSVEKIGDARSIQTKKYIAPPRTFGSKRMRNCTHQVCNCTTACTEARWKRTLPCSPRKVNASKEVAPNIERLIMNLKHGQNAFRPRTRRLSGPVASNVRVFDILQAASVAAAHAARVLLLRVYSIRCERAVVLVVNALNSIYSQYIFT